MADQPKPGDRRYTVSTLAAGQPRAYADTIHHVRITFEIVPYGGDGSWQPSPINNEQMVRDSLKGLMCGFTEFTYPRDRPSTTEDHYRTRLDWLRNVAPGVWEFHTTSPFTD